MNQHIKNFGKKYIPNFLKPSIYGLYSFLTYHCLCYIAKHITKKQQKEFKIFQQFVGKKIVQILQPTFYDTKGKIYFSGGAERYLNDLAEIIIGMGYTVIILQIGDKLWHKLHNNIHVIGVPSFGNYRIFNKISHKLFQEKPKLIIYSPFVLACDDVDETSIGISHGIFWDHPHSKAIMPIIRKSFQNLDTIVSVDTSTISWFRGSMQHSISKKSIRYIPNYVDLQTFYPISRKGYNKLRIIYPRRLYEQRGYFLVHAIIDDIIEKYKNVEFHFVGHADKDAELSVHKLIKKHGKYVQLYQQPADDMPLIYQNADIVLIPTTSSEGTSLSCIEAMATGNAIIATNVGGLSDLIINGHNGLLIAPEAHELKLALEKLIESPELRTRLGKNALEVSKCFDKKIWQSQWKELLESKLNN